MIRKRCNGHKSSADGAFCSFKFTLRFRRFFDVSRIKAVRCGRGDRRVIAPWIALFNIALRPACRPDRRRNSDAAVHGWRWFDPPKDRVARLPKSARSAQRPIVTIPLRPGMSAKKQAKFGHRCTVASGLGLRRCANNMVWYGSTTQLRSGGLPSRS